MLTNKITQKQWDECSIIINKYRITTQEVGIMMNLFNQFVDAGSKCCGTCPTQIRFIHKRFKDWFNNVTIIEDDNDYLKCVICEEPIFDKRRKETCSARCKIVKKNQKNKL